jgi:hypothetical protein
MLTLLPGTICCAAGAPLITIASAAAVNAAQT